MFLLMHIKTTEHKNHMEEESRKAQIYFKCLECDHIKFMMPEKLALF